MENWDRKLIHTKVHPLTLRHWPLDIQGGGGGACIEVRAQFFFSLRFRARLFFFHQFRAQFFFSQIFFHHFQEPRVSKSVRHWRTGAIRRWHTAIAAGGVGTARSGRVVDTLRCIINLIWGPNDWFQMMIFVLFWENKLAFFPLSFGVQGCLAVVHCHCDGGLWAAQGPQKPEGSRCSEMHSQPYLSPKLIIPDGNSSCIEKTIYPFYLFMVCRADCGKLPLRPGVWALWGPLKAPRSQRVLDALRCILRLIWDASFSCAGLSGRSPIFFFMESEHNYFFQRISGHDYFFQRISGHDYFFQFYTRPPPGYLMVNA